MSYILDALRRADAERERGGVPGIHAQPVPVPSPEDLGRSAPLPWRWIAVGVSAGLVLAFALLWGLAGGDGTAPAEPGGAPPPHRPLEAAAPPEAAAAPPAPPPAALASPLTTLPAPIERRPTSSEAAIAERKAAAAAPASAAGPASAPGAGRIVARHELPEDIRRQLPPVNVSGSMYSSDPASRFLIVNGQVLHENAQLGPDHVLVQIKLRAAVLRFKGQLYEITY